MKTAPAGQEFHFCDGVAAESVETLVEHIKVLSPEQFKNHVNKERNDFFNWINDCVDPAVAKEIKSLKSQRSVIEKLTGHAWQKEHKKKHKY